MVVKKKRRPLMFLSRPLKRKFKGLMLNRGKEMNSLSRIACPHSQKGLTV